MQILRLARSGYRRAVSGLSRAGGSSGLRGRLDHRHSTGRLRGTRVTSSILPNMAVTNELETFFQPSPIHTLVPAFCLTLSQILHNIHLKKSPLSHSFRILFAFFRLKNTYSHHLAKILDTYFAFTLHANKTFVFVFVKAIELC